MAINRRQYTASEKTSSEVNRTYKLNVDVWFVDTSLLNKLPVCLSRMLRPAKSRSALLGPPVCGCSKRFGVEL